MTITGFEMTRGLPRPLYNWTPVPYTAEVSQNESGEAKVLFAQIDSDRQGECETERLCIVCGAELDDTVALITRCRPESGDRVLDGEMHERCAKLSFRHCPHLRDDPYDEHPKIWTGAKPDGAVHGGDPVPTAFERLRSSDERRRARAA